MTNDYYDTCEIKVEKFYRNLLNILSKTGNGKISTDGTDIICDTPEEAENIADFIDDSLNVMATFTRPVTVNGVEKYAVCIDLD